MGLLLAYSRGLKQTHVVVLLVLTSEAVVVQVLEVAVQAGPMETVAAVVAAV